MDGNALTEGNFEVDMNQVVVTGMGVLTSVGTAKTIGVGYCPVNPESPQ